MLHVGSLVAAWELQASLVAQMVKSLPAMWKTWARSWVGKIPWRRAWQPIPIFLLGKRPWTEEPDGYSPWGLKESAMTEQLSMHMWTLSCGMWNLVPWLGIEPRLAAWECRVLATGPPGKSNELFCFFFFQCMCLVSMQKALLFAHTMWSPAFVFVG